MTIKREALNTYVVFASAHHGLAKQKQVSLAEPVGERWASTNSLARPLWQSFRHSRKTSCRRPR